MAARFFALAIGLFVVFGAAAWAQDDQSWRDRIGTKDGSGGCVRAYTPDHNHWYYDCGENTVQCKGDEIAVHAQMAKLDEVRRCNQLRAIVSDRMCTGFERGPRERCEQHVGRAVSAHCGDTLRLGGESVCIPKFKDSAAPVRRQRMMPSSTGTEPISGACSYLGTC